MVYCISISLDCNKSIIKDFYLPSVASTFDTLSIVSTWASKGSGRDNLSIGDGCMQNFSAFVGVNQGSSHCLHF